jgi:hypothetical protein
MAKSERRAHGGRISRASSPEPSRAVVVALRTATGGGPADRSQPPVARRASEAC